MEVGGLIVAMLNNLKRTNLLDLYPHKDISVKVNEDYTFSVYECKGFDKDDYFNPILVELARYETILPDGFRKDSYIKLSCIDIIKIGSHEFAEYNPFHGDRVEVYYNPSEAVGFEVVSARIERDQQVYPGEDVYADFLVLAGELADDFCEIEPGSNLDANVNINKVVITRKYSSLGCKTTAKINK